MECFDHRPAIPGLASLQRAVASASGNGRWPRKAGGALWRPFFLFLCDKTLPACLPATRGEIRRRQDRVRACGTSKVFRSLPRDHKGQSGMDQS